MKKQDIILRYLSSQYLNGIDKYTQLSLSRELDLSLSQVNFVVSTLREIGAVRVNRRSFELISLNRLLMFWATHRNLRKDIIYSARADAPILEIERSMPDKIAYTGFTAYKLIFGETPADYSEVYVYTTEKALEILKNRFPRTNYKIPNILVLKSDTLLDSEIKAGKLEKSSVCKGQLFVDLWNMNQWYAKEYVDQLSKRLVI